MKHNKTYTVDEAQKALEHYCSYRERTHNEVAQKLQNMGMIQSVCAEIIMSLMQNNFLNEGRFAKAYVSGKFNINKWGRIKIKQGLLQKGISNANINEALNEINPDDYLKILQSLIDKYQLTNKETNAFKRKQKLLNYLQQKGYEASVIYECLSDD